MKLSDYLFNARDWVVKVMTDEGLENRDGFDADVLDALYRAGRMAQRDNAYDVVQVASFAQRWDHDGRPIYALAHSIAALLSVTKAPPMALELPHHNFAVRIPSQFVRCPGPCDEVFALVKRRRNGDGMGMGVAWSPRVVTPWIEFDFDADVWDESRWDERTFPDKAWAHCWKSCLRIVSNAVAYITSHRESVREPNRNKSGVSDGVYSVSAPRNMTVDREFRSLASNIVKGDGGFVGVKRTLSHMVRGHWKRQACGVGRSDRKMTWVMPYRRGDESLGSVVERVHRIAEISALTS